MTIPTINMIPSDVLDARLRRRHLIRWGMAIIILAAALCVPLVLDVVHRARASVLRDESNQLFTRLEHARAKIRTTTAEAANLLGRIERADALRAKRPWVSVFALIASCVPDRVWLSYIATDPATASGGPQLPLVAPTPGAKMGERNKTITLDVPRQLRLRGYADDHEQPYVFVTRLKESGAFDRVMLVRSVNESVLDGSAVAFELVCEW